MRLRFMAMAHAAVFTGTMLVAAGLLIGTGTADAYRSADGSRVGIVVGPVGAEYDRAPGARAVGLWGCVDHEPQWEWYCRMTGTYGIDIHRETEKP